MALAGVKTVICHAIAFVALCAPISALSETVIYYDCNRSDRTMTYRSEPCHENEWEIRRYEVDLSIFDNSNKESVGMTQGAPIELHPNASGNYTVEGTINGHTVNFMVDTGASFVSITKQAASDFGITGCATGEGKAGKGETANGIVDTCTTIAKQLTFSGFQLSDVAITIMPGTTPVLLGMNVLKQFKIETTNGVMRISRQ